MSVLTIKNSHKSIDELQASGASKELAASIVETIQKAELQSDPATKADLAGLKAEMYRALLVHGLLVSGAVIGASKFL